MWPRHTAEWCPALKWKQILLALHHGLHEKNYYKQIQTITDRTMYYISLLSQNAGLVLSAQVPKRMVGILFSFSLEREKQKGMTDQSGGRTLL